jgi:hypothetical protein
MSTETYTRNSPTLFPEKHVSAEFKICAASLEFLATVDFSLYCTLFLSPWKHLLLNLPLIRLILILRRYWLSSLVNLEIICLIIQGSRGDVQPAFLIAGGFVQKGYHVRIACHASFREMAKAYGVTDYAPLSGEPQGNDKSYEIVLEILSGSWSNTISHLV